MKTRNLIIIAILILVAIISGGWFWQSQAASSDELVEATGTIEVRRVSLGPEIGGMISEVFFEEGDRVTAGQPLVKLGDSLLVTQRSQAVAALQAAQANLALLKAGATQDQVQAAEASLAQAEANLRMTEASLDALTAGSRPDEISAMRASLDRARANYRTMRVVFTSDQIEEVRSALTVAESNLSAATGRLDELKKDTYNPAFVVASAERTVADANTALAVDQEVYETVTDESQLYYVQVELARLSWEVAQSNLALAKARHNGLLDDERTTREGLDAAKAAHNDADDQVEASKTAFESLTSGVSAQQLDAAWDEVQRAQSDLEGTAALLPNFSNAPLSVETLLSQVDTARALVDIAAANLASTKNGARAEEIAAAQAQVDAAQAQLDGLDIQLDKATIYAPWSGVVLNRSAEVGQMTLPATLLLEIGRLDTVELTVYLPEDLFGLVTLGQIVTVMVDAYPDRTFSGTVMRLSDEAEFTPTNVQTKDDRTRLVYGVKISLDNPDLSLKPGMYADVIFEK